MTDEPKYKIRILIIEDELIIAQDLSEILTLGQYEVCDIAKTYEDGLRSLIEHKPDLVLLDIQIKGDKDGIDFAKTLRDRYTIPFLFISSHTDRITLDRAKATNPYGFIVKPFEEEDVRVALEIALTNFRKEQNPHPNGDDFIINESLFIRQKDLAIRIPYHDILYASADSNYCTIHTAKGKFVLRSTLKDLEEKLPGSMFYRSHKSYLVNLDKITALNTDWVHIGKESLPIGREHYQWLIGRINKL